MQLAKSLTSRDILLGLLAAATHDLDHPGVNQPFLIKTDHYLATLYRVKPLGSQSHSLSGFNRDLREPKHFFPLFDVQNTSVLENHHWKSAVGLLRETGLFSHLPAEDRSDTETTLKTSLYFQRKCHSRRVTL